MPMRSFSLNSDDAHELLCQREDRPWIRNGALPPEPRWGERSDPLSVSAETEAEGGDAVREWMRVMPSAREALRSKDELASKRRHSRGWPAV